MAYGSRDSFGSRDRGRSSDRGSRGRRDSFGGGRDSFDSGFGERRGRPEMHDAVCDKCGNACQLPFKPRNSKPVFCSDCFRKKDSFDSGKPSQMDNEQLSEINKKLDKIMKILKAD